MEALKAAISAGEHGSTSSLQPILACTKDQAPALRQTALSALTYLVDKGDSEALVALTIAAGTCRLDDADSCVRQAARALLATLAEKSQPSLIAALSAIATCSRTDAQLRQEAVEALSAMALRGDKTAVAAVTRSLECACLEVRREAVAALGDIAAYNDPEVIALLCDCCADPDPTVRSALAHASAIVAPRGDLDMVRALRTLLEDSHSEVRARALMALAAIAQPGDQQTLAAVSACAADPDERVRAAVSRASAMLEIPLPAARETDFHPPQPLPIEGVKSKKTALLRFSADMCVKSSCCAATCSPSSSSSLFVSLSSRIALKIGGAGATQSLAAIMQLEACVWRHPRARIGFIARNAAQQLSVEHGKRTPLEYLSTLALQQEHSTSEVSQSSAAAHLEHFGIHRAAAGLSIAELPRSELACLLLAAAFWPRPPQVLVLEEPTAWGFSDLPSSLLRHLVGNNNNNSNGNSNDNSNNNNNNSNNNSSISSSSNRSFQGGVVLATESEELARSFADERWVLTHGLLQQDCC
ncbi:unnamed protein product [Polarella glacialis]|uniref:Uncharacterized protein n=1 Tax=Polarella glacialis TaxID=89957 RepID=A0A813JRF7_POLGL|nr:unnamed protein product [Polarella glacialis]